jgi:hypothetical protein
VIELTKTGPAQNILFLRDTQESLHLGPFVPCRKPFFAESIKVQAKKMCFFSKRGFFLLSRPLYGRRLTAGPDPNPTISVGFLPKALVNKAPMFILLHQGGPEMTEPVSKKGKKR